MLLIIGTVRLPADSLERARPSMAAMLQATRAEDGCLEYSYSADVLDPGVIHITERWRDQTALDEHFKSAHMSSWRESWPSLGIREPRLYVYEVGEPKGL